MTIVSRVGRAVAAIILLSIGLALAAHNYRECRARDFSRTYCASTHLVR
jgi:hypothetical protein